MASLLDAETPMGWMGTMYLLCEPSGHCPTAWKSSLGLCKIRRGISS